MNRWDEIRAAALDSAQHVTGDPVGRDRLADDLIRLIGLMVGAVGKAVALQGEADIVDAHCSDPECDCAENGCKVDAEGAHSRYLVGECMQDGSVSVVSQSVKSGCDIERWGGDAWRPRCRECGVRPVCHLGQQELREAGLPYGTLWPDHAEGCKAARSGSGNDSDLASESPRADMADCRGDDPAWVATPVTLWPCSYCRDMFPSDQPGHVCPALSRKAKQHPEGDGWRAHEPVWTPAWVAYGVRARDGKGDTYETCGICGRVKP